VIFDRQGGPSEHYQDAVQKGSAFLQMNSFQHAAPRYGGKGRFRVSKVLGSLY